MTYTELDELDEETLHYLALSIQMTAQRHARNDTEYQNIQRAIADEIVRQAEVSLYGA